MEIPGCPVVISHDRWFLDRIATHILEIPGCPVVISHDRWFLDRIATHILAFEGESEVVWHDGNYESYKADLKWRKGVDADQPHRVHYKKLVRA